jgi:chorismate dehydratase
MPTDALKTDNKLRVVAVSYLNTKPFTEGLASAFSPSELSVTLQVPSECARAFAAGEADLALVPVGALLDFPEVSILDRYCIGAAGQVDSVFVVANAPIDSIDTLYLDPNSRTSNGLARVLFANHWRREIACLHAPDYLDRIAGTAAGVLIGDRAIALRDQFSVVIDLAAAWQTYSGLPFTFAVWVYRPDRLSGQQLTRIFGAFDQGMAARHRVAATWASAYEMSVEAAERYLTHSIDYTFDGPKQVALTKYLTELAAIESRSLPEVALWPR